MAAFFNSIHLIIFELLFTASMIIAGYKRLREEWLSSLRPKRARKKVRRSKRVSGAQPVRALRQDRH